MHVVKIIKIVYRFTCLKFDFHLFKRKTMKKIFFLFLLFITSLGYTQKVYQSTHQDSCHIKFFAVHDRDSADICVYKADTNCRIIKDGVWYIAAFPKNSLFVYKFVESINDADLNVFFVNSATEAGWITNNKKGLYLYARKRR